jgi:hypothetical protein
MQNEREELDEIVDIYYSKAEAMAFFDKIQFHFDEIISKAVEGIQGQHHEAPMITSVAEYYSHKINGMLDYCKDFINLFDDSQRIAVRRMINIFDTVQVDLVAMNEDETKDFPEIELIDPKFEPTLRTVVLEIALRVIDEDIKNLSYKANEKLQDAIIMEIERRRMEEEGLL